MMEWVGSEMKRIQAGGYCRNVTGIEGNYLVPRACLMNMAIFIQKLFFLTERLVFMEEISFIAIL